MRRSIIRLSRHRRQNELILSFDTWTGILLISHPDLLIIPVSKHTHLTKHTFVLTPKLVKKKEKKE